MVTSIRDVYEAIETTPISPVKEHLCQYTDNWSIIDSRRIRRSRMTGSVSQNLADNILAIRRRRNWSQSQLATRAGIPRSTIANMESGDGNPSLTNLAGVSGALGVGIEELVSRPRSECSLVRAADVPVRQRSRGRVRISKLLPEKVRGLEIDGMDFDTGASMGGTPHVLGTKEYFCCLEGRMQVLVTGQAFDLAAGDVLAFPGDQRHSYRSPGHKGGKAVSIVVPVPVGADGAD
jgi:transcriptional regulator with XRE-family HTH domain